MKKKKLVSMLLVGAMTFSLLAGCGSKPTDAGTADVPASEVEGGSVSTETAGSQEAAFQKFPEVVEVHIGQGVSPTDTLPEGLSVENNQYTDYLLENFNIKVVVDWTAASGNDYTQKVALCIASNTLPDAMTVSREYMLKAARSGQLYDITDLFQQMQSPQVKEVMESTGGEAIKEASVDGRQYAIPATEVETAGIQVINIRQDWLDECGLEAPKTLDDVENIAKVFAEKKPAGEDTIPIAGPDKNTNCYTTFQETATTTGGFDAVFSANDCYPGIFLKDENGNVIQTIDPVLEKKTISKETSDKLKSYMYSVVQNGSGRYAQVEGYDIGGKTGTAEKLPRGENKNVVSFIGYAPQENPEIMIYVVIDEPNAPDQSATSSLISQLASDIMAEAFPYLNITKAPAE
mgnify:CR=1 FL=1